MQKIKILHRTYYNFSSPVELGTHYLRLRPREGHELRIESSTLSVTPDAVIAWQSDIENNSIATATFSGAVSQLAIESETVVQQYNENPFDFLIESFAVQFPFAYQQDDWFTLAPYTATANLSAGSPVASWAAGVWNGTESIQTISLLLRIADRIRTGLQYGIREEPGVQDPIETLSRGTGSCRDFAALFIAVARHLGLAARFVSGYLVAAPNYIDYGATHAWAEVYLPGAGWKGFDPTLGLLTGSDHIPVAVSRLPDSVPPIAGSFTGFASATMDIGVWVTPF
jgi:transglutaminase-like putative cysteine protease